MEVTAEFDPETRRATLSITDQTTGRTEIVSWVGYPPRDGSFGESVERATVALGVRDANGTWLCEDPRAFSDGVAKAVIFLGKECGAACRGATQE